MPDSLLLLVPPLVLALVLLLGFAGCDKVFGLQPLPPTPEPTLTFRARVSTGLAVLPPGVRFTWTRPGGLAESEDVPPLPPAPSVETYVAAALALGPSLFWTLGSVNGLTDRSGNGRNGTALGGVAVGGEADGPTDHLDARATHFDGVDDRIGSNYSPSTGTGGRTFVGWTRRDSNTTQDLLFGSSAALTTNQARLLLGANQNVRFEPSGDDGQVVVWTDAWPQAVRWVSWALRFDLASDAVTLFLDGQSVSTKPCQEVWPAAAGNFQVGAAGTTNVPLAGESGLIGVYEKLLTDQELADLHATSQAGEVIYERDVPTAEAGSWLGRCQLTVQGEGASAAADSLDFSFDLPATSDRWVLVFASEGSPATSTFGVRAVGLTTE